jgi:hypothetical protein
MFDPVNSRVADSLRRRSVPWGGSDDPTSQILAACGTTAEFLQSCSPGHRDRALADKAAHLLSARLYGRDDQEALEDYLWWCEKAGEPPETASAREVDAWLAKPLAFRD